MKAFIQFGFSFSQMALSILRQVSERVALLRIGTAISLKPPICLPPSPTLLLQERSAANTSFFTKRTGDELWKSVTSVSSAGRKKGRASARRRARSKNLNLGQLIGHSMKRNIQWPGLNAPILAGRDYVKRHEIPVDTNYVQKIHDTRDKQGKYRRPRQTPLERGWSGGAIHGKKLGPPIDHPAYKDFETIILFSRPIRGMSGQFGRTLTRSIMVVTGDKNGLIGFGIAEGPTVRTALQAARRKAANRLIYIDRFNGHTVHHNFWSKFGVVRLWVYSRPPGFGLKMPRVLAACCHVLGITDLEARKNLAEKEADMNISYLVQCFLMGLMRQKTHQELADETGYLVVQTRPEEGNFPRLLAEPKEEKQNPRESEIPDYDLYCYKGAVPFFWPDRGPFCRTLPSWERKMYSLAYLKNYDKTRTRIEAEHGYLRNQYNDRFPECKGRDGKARRLRHIRIILKRQEEAAAED